MSSMAMAEIPDSFLYFAYGSNLLKKRIHINNPSAEFLGIGKLEGHQLDFMGYSKRWGGCSATIVPTQGEHIWGAIWRLDDKDMPALDKQEGVGDNWYFPRNVAIILPDGMKVHCRTYQQTKNPPPRRPGEKIPQDRLPSITYMDVIVRGAIECQMPNEYIEVLKNIPNNGNQADEKMLELLKEKEEPKLPTTFYYFAYGPNLLTFRVHMYSPSAEFVSIARLDNYRLDFIHYSKFWGGPEATIVPTANAHVWGAIWEIHRNDLVSLDDCKGVDIKRYYYKYAKVLTPHIGYFTCRLYIAKVNPLPRGDNDVIPVENWPSWTYKEMLILGAIEHEFPEYYIEQLRKLPDNGEEAYLRTVCLLIRYEKEEPCQCAVPGRIPRKPLQLDLKKLKKEQQKQKPIKLSGRGNM